MTTREFLKQAAAIPLLLVLCGVASAQVSDTETFNVTVAPSLSITAPSPSVTIAHDTTDGNQAFAAQTWQVQTNARNGATVVFSTNQAFTHTTDNTYVRDARLDLSIASASPAANWGVTVATDQTDFATADGVATVQAASTKAGNATFDLTVTLSQCCITPWPTGLTKQP